MNLSQPPNHYNTPLFVVNTPDLLDLFGLLHNVGNVRVETDVKGFPVDDDVFTQIVPMGTGNKQGLAACAGYRTGGVNPDG